MQKDLEAQRTITIHVKIIETGKEIKKRREVPKTLTGSIILAHVWYQKRNLENILFH